MKKWNENDLIESINLLKSGLTYREIGLKIGRTRKSVRIKLNKNGYYINDKTYNETVVCINCGKEFISNKKEKRKFCSRSCAAKTNNTLYPKLVKNTSVLKENRKKYTRTNFNDISKNKIVDKKLCLKCGKEINNRQKYCSHDCKIELERINKYTFYLNNTKNFNRANFHPKTWLKKTIMIEQNHRCSICGLDNRWNDKILVFVLDHIDGDATNNKRENLRCVCPNCDSQLDTYKSKNKNCKREYRKKYYNNNANVAQRLV